VQLHVSGVDGHPQDRPATPVLDQALPAANMAVLPLAVLTALAAVLIVGGLGGLTRRDIG
jgi:hypothetical protein